MAINPGSTYPGQTVPPNAAYPQGSAKDVTAPGTGDGTPLRALWVNDLWGFQQAILAEAGFTPSGLAETATASQYLSGLKKILTGRLIARRVFTANGTYTPTAGTTKVIVTVVGGGGGGGGTFSTSASQNASGSGGGGGAEAIGVFTTGFSGVTMTIGPAGVSAAGANGTDGGVTSFGTLLTAEGGKGGPRGLAATSGNTSGSAGGITVTGTAIISKAGQDGGAGTVYSIGTTLSGKGGDTNYGRGGSPGGTGSTAGSGTAGANGKDYGAGGAGAAGAISNVALSGGSGRPGVIIVEEYA